METHPYSPPMVYVKPSSTMLLRPGWNVDSNGKVNLPYLQDWRFVSKTFILDTTEYQFRVVYLSFVKYMHNYVNCKIRFKNVSILHYMHGKKSSGSTPALKISFRSPEGISDSCKLRVVRQLLNTRTIGVSVTGPRR